MPKDAENQKAHVFVCFCPCVKKHVFLCVFLESTEGPCNKTHVFCLCFRTFEAEVAPKQNIRIKPGLRKTRVFVGFCVWAAFMLPRAKCEDLYVFLNVFEVFLKREAGVGPCGDREARWTKME